MAYPLIVRKNSLPGKCTNKAVVSMIPFQWVKYLHLFLCRLAEVNCNDVTCSFPRLLTISDLMEYYKSTIFSIGKMFALCVGEKNNFAQED